MESHQEVLELSPCWDMLNPIEQVQLILHLETLEKEIKNAEKGKNSRRTGGQKSAVHPSL